MKQRIVVHLRLDLTVESILLEQIRDGVVVHIVRMGHGVTAAPTGDVSLAGLDA